MQRTRQLGELAWKLALQAHAVTKYQQFNGQLRTNAWSLAVERINIRVIDCDMAWLLDRTVAPLQQTRWLTRWGRKWPMRRQFAELSSFCTRLVDYSYIHVMMDRQSARPLWSAPGWVTTVTNVTWQIGRMTKRDNSFACSADSVITRKVDKELLLRYWQFKAVFKYFAVSRNCMIKLHRTY